jgi:Domain of unknown function (DUF397)
VTASEGLSKSTWRRSSACGHGNCVEVQFDQTMVRVRNSRRPEQMVEFTVDEWGAFMAGAGAGEFEAVGIRCLEGGR